MDRKQIILIFFYFNFRLNKSLDLTNDDTKWIRIQANGSWIPSIVESKLPGNAMILNGKIKMATKKCCPFIFVGHHLMGVPVKDGCLNMTYDNILPLIGRKFYLLDWRTEQKRKAVDCQYPKGEIYTCHFEGLTDDMAKLGFGKVFIFYPCLNRQPVDILIDISLHGKNITNRETNCLPLGFESPCRKYYNHSLLPNIYGQSAYQEVHRSIAIIQMAVNQNCHKYAEEFVCYSFLPKCQNHKKTLPCKSTCTEVYTVCVNHLKYADPPSTQLKLYGSTFDITEIFHLSTYFCEELPESDCYKAESVTCENPSIIENGMYTSTGTHHPVNSTVEYQCKSGYKLDTDGTVTCQYSGTWSRIPRCLIKTTHKDLIIICSVFGIIIMLIIVTICLAWKYRLEISAVIYARYGIKLKREREEKRKYDVYITYSQHDFYFVKNKLLDPLEKITFKVCIPERDFGPGDFRSQNIIKGVQSSKRTIIILSQNFLNSGWCQFELAQAHLKMLEDESFKLLLIAIEEPKTLENVPKVIANYINARTYLMENDKLFWEKLLYQMPKVKDRTRKRPADQRENEVQEAEL